MLLKNYFYSLLALLFSFQAIGQKISQKSIKLDSTEFKVGYIGSEPFVVHQDNLWTGISVEIWEAIASKKEWNYSEQSFAGAAEAIAALQAGKIDMIVGPLSITSERAEKVQFTQPYFQSSLSILSRTDEPSLWGRMSPFFSMKLLYAILLFLFILACVGTLLWFAERKASPEQFPAKPMRGIGNGMWCAIVTMSTTGYGDIAPVTLFGRIVAGSWMVISIIFATSMVAGIASTLTLTGMGVSTISTVEQFKNKKIAVLENSPAIEFVKEHRGKIKLVKNVDEGYTLLKEKKVAGFVFDRPQLQYFLEQNPTDFMVLSVAQYLKQGYGFAYPLSSERVHDVNVQLLRLKETGEMDEIISNWLGNYKD